MAKHKQEGDNLAGAALDGAVADTHAPKDPPKADGEKAPPPKEAAPDSWDPAKKKKAQTDYEKLVQEVKELAEVSATPGFRRIWKGLERDIDDHARALLTVEKTREIIRHQEGAALFTGLRAVISRPVREIQELQTRFPMFAGLHSLEVDWDEDKGLCTWKEKPAAKAK